MAHFSYRGRDAQGKETRGELEAASEMAAAEILMRRGVLPTEIRARRASSIDIDWAQLFESPMRLDELVVFTRQMYSLTRAGIPILRAMAGLAETTSSKPLKRALVSLGEELGNGKPLSTAMQAHPKVFSSLFIAIVRVGENTGQLEESFLQLANYFELEQDTRKRIKTALRYPSFVMLALAVAMVILNIFVIPAFADMFSKFGAELPLATRILLATSHFFTHYWWLLLAGVVGGVFGWRWWTGTTEGELTWHRWQMRLPIVGDIIERTLLARFSRTFSMMLRAGVPLNTALTLVSDSVDNAWMAQRTREMRSGIERGESLLRTASQSQLFTPLVLQMIAVGEETGQVDELMLEVAQFYEREVDYDLKSLTARIEPILIGIVAVMVLILALGIFTPMWDMMSAIKGKS